MKVCTKCGIEQHESAFYANGEGRRASVCKFCKRKKGDNADFKIRAVELWHARMPIKDIARQVGFGDRTVAYWLKQAGIETAARRKEGGDWARRGDPDALLPIGEPKTGIMAKIDRAIARDRKAAGMVDGRRRLTANGWPTASSLVS